MPRSRESQHSSGPGAPAGEADAAPPAPSDDRIRAESAAEHPLEAPGEDWSVLPRPAERTAPPRIQILSPAPMIDCGRFAAKRTVGEWVDVSADVFRDGHEIVRAVVRYRGPSGEDWREAPMQWIDRDVDGDRWASAFELDRVGRWEFTFEAWSDLLATVERHPDRHDATRLDRILPLEVERERARFGAWYELFPRSFGGFEGVRRQLPRLAELGFDVIYLPPIHPIGHTNRKGRNNSLRAAPGDPGSPWAIGSEEGGDEAIHPDLRTVEEVERLA